MNVAGLSLRDLEYVVAIADERHFGRAAERCNVSQPTLSAQVRKLEEALGLVLFERTNRRVLLTERGQAIVRQARHVLAEAQQLLVMASEGGGAPLTGRSCSRPSRRSGPTSSPRAADPAGRNFRCWRWRSARAAPPSILAGLREGRVDAALLSLPFAESGSPWRRSSSSRSSSHARPTTRSAAAPAIRAPTAAGPDLLLLDEGNCLRDQTIAACGAGNAAGPPRDQPRDPALDGGGGRAATRCSRSPSLRPRSGRPHRDPRLRTGTARAAPSRSPGGRATRARRACRTGRFLPGAGPSQHHRLR